MEVIGDGFLAHHLRPVRTVRPDAVVIAAGVSGSDDRAYTEYRREAELVDRTIRRCRRDGQQLILFSTASAGMYGDVECRGMEDEPVTPISVFGRHKLEMEAAVRDSGVRHLILRLAHVVGPGQRGHQLVPALTRQLRTGRVTVYRSARRDILGAAEFTRITGELLCRGVEDQIVNVGTGVSTAVERIVDHLEERLGTTAERSYTDGAKSSCALSMDKLRRLVPAIDRMGFGPDYYRTVIDRYLENP
ncbi:NAD-dependent epimerase/dehydratase family protein [Streptomyces sp. NPDC053427]|uniref:NAD-dependent epimerase/dehydratase family protein n=1 Tax=Streptomyces sp. NPDC053427 TaxID=3365701 RepID=UPI0037CCE5A2